MDQFCGSEFWNANVTWYTDDPDFTECLEKTVLVWIPCTFLWVFAPLDAYYLATSTSRDVPWGFLNVTKLLAIALLVVLSGLDLAYAAYEDLPPADLYAPVFKICTFVLAGVLVAYSRERGLRTSGVAFFFWLLLLACGCFRYQTEIRKAIDDARIEQVFSLVSHMVYLPLVLASFLLACWADKPPRFTELPPDENPCAKDAASFPSQMTFSWFDSLVLLGYRRPLTASDMWSLSPEDSTRQVVPRFQKQWTKLLVPTLEVDSSNGAEYPFLKSPMRSLQGSRKPTASVATAILKTFWFPFLGGSLLMLLSDMLIFISPQILSLLIGFVGSDQPTWRGYMYASAMFIAGSAQSIVLKQYYDRVVLVGMRVRTALMSMIYRKALLMSSAARRVSSIGEIVNLMSVDTQRLIDLTTYLDMMWSAPLKIALSLYFLWNVLGASVLAGLVLMVVLTPINAVIATRIKKLQVKQMRYKDERVSLTSEVLSSIKTLKLYAWEKSFEQKILEVRAKEVGVLKQAAYLDAVSQFIWICTPFMVSLVTFVTYTLVDPNNVLDAEKTFVSLALFNVMGTPMSFLPILMTMTVQALVSVKRINRFMNLDEIDPSHVQHDNTATDPITMENGTFSWGAGEEPTLRNINLSVKRASLVAVVGSVGAGKSSLLSAFLGEMHKMAGRVNIQGSVAYAPQQAWIQNASLRDNILFGRPLDATTYDRVVEACALKPDLAMLPAGDQTEVGEKGINLSGGQKQRVSLARAVLSDADLYFLDDPLSAVDSHVGKHIFDNVIGRSGILKKKTRVLVTHGVTFLPRVDLIIVLTDGQVTETGTYRELLEKKGAFAEFLAQHLSQSQVQRGDSVEETRQQHLEFGEMDQVNFTKQEGGPDSMTDNSFAEVNGSGSKAIQRQKSVKGEEDILLEKIGKKLIHEETSETGSVSRSVYAYYLGAMGVRLCIAVVGFNIVYQAFSVGSNMWLARWSNASRQPVNGTEALETPGPGRNMYLAVYAVLGTSQAVAILLAYFALARAALTAAMLMHNQMLARTLRNPMQFFDTTPIGRVVNRFSKDVDVIENIIPARLRTWVTYILAVMSTLFVISYSTPMFITVIIPTGAIYIFVQRFYIVSSRQLKRLKSVAMSPIYSHFAESIAGISTIRAFDAQDRFIGICEEKIDYSQKCSYPSTVSNRWLAVRLELVGNLVIFFAAMFAVLGRDSVDSGVAGLSISYALQITHLLNFVVRMTSELEANIVAVERVKEYSETEQENPWERPADDALPVHWPSRGKVRFHNYHARYRPGLELVVKGVSFDVEGGEKVGVVGRTGAGKSTLTQGLFRLVEPADGRIEIDGVDISTLGLQTLRSRLTIIPQDPVLFARTLRANLDPFDAHSDAELWRVIEHAHLRAFVKGLPAELNYEVSEGGGNLSVGQRQLVCLARALLRKTSVLVLDEATAAVDLETDDLIQATIRTAFKHCTVLTIAHRLNTILDSDRVLVLDNGKAVEFAPPTALLQDEKSAFYKMAKDARLL